MKRRKVRILAMSLALLLAFTAAGCGGAEQNKGSAAVENEENSEVPENTEAETDAAESEPAEEKSEESESSVESEEAISAEVTESSESEEEEPLEPEYYETYSSINELAVQNGFTLGAAMGTGQMNYSAYKDMTAWHFGSLTSTNEMKAYCLLDQAASRKSKDGMPVMNYEAADRVVAFAQENGMGVRGHVLVWDADMCDWFFRKGYEQNGAYVDAETMKVRLQYYIEAVITHFEEEFPGVVYCWDVVNEAVGDGKTDYAAEDSRHVRICRNGKDNLFYNQIGSDYVELSFLYARDTVEKLQKSNPDVDIKLFYNDYNTFYDEKRDAIIELVKSINSYAKDGAGNYRKLCDGVGMQSYIGGYGKQDGCMNSGDLKRIEKAIQMYADLGLEVHATETAVRNYKDDEAALKKHAEFYGKLFEIYVNANKDREPVVTNVSIWGLQDDPYLDKNSYSYKMNGPFCGLFDRSLCVKDSFREVYKVLSGE